MEVRPPGLFILEMFPAGWLLAGKAAVLRTRHEQCGELGAALAAVHCQVSPRAEALISLARGGCHGLPARRCRAVLSVRAKWRWKPTSDWPPHERHWAY